MNHPGAVLRGELTFVHQFCRLRKGVRQPGHGDTLEIAGTLRHPGQADQRHQELLRGNDLQGGTWRTDPRLI